MTEPDIPREELEAMFDAIRENTEWDLDGDLLWGYFFTHTDRKTLEAAAETLQADGYQLVQIFEAE
ncbi:MAG: ribonuclease E inhibitor RraB, partial [Maioricimonas sp. JB049]